MTFADLSKEYEENELISAEYIGEKKVAGRRENCEPHRIVRIPQSNLRVIESLNVCLRGLIVLLFGRHG